VVKAQLSGYRSVQRLPQFDETGTNEKVESRHQNSD
jgi:hypothetical protein